MEIRNVLKPHEKRELIVAVRQHHRKCLTMMNVRTTAIIDIGGEKLLTQQDKDALARLGDRATASVPTADLFHLVGGNAVIAPEYAKAAEE